MRGECTGKVRSTPTPYEIRRTVNDAPAPPPRFLITTPSNACRRSFSPSTTFTDTRTVSPGSNPPRSRLSSAASTIWMASIGLSSLDEIGRSPPVAEPVGPLLFLRREVRGEQEIRPALPRAPDRHHPPPPRDPTVA